MTPLQKVLFIASPLLLIGFTIATYALTQAIPVLSIYGFVTMICLLIGGSLFFKNLARHLDSKQTHL